MNQSEKRLFLIQSLLKENPAYRDWGVPQDADDQKRLLRGLMNVRPAQNSSAEFLKIQDEYLREVTAQKGVTDADSLSPVQPGICLWQGDITTLRCDAIVNAVNSGMTGCYVPNHRCIDNAIHTFAGVELRLACEELMEQQGYPEPTGQAKITPALFPTRGTNNCCAWSSSSTAMFCLKKVEAAKMIIAELIAQPITMDRSVS